jgi:hypothetical protein
VRYPDLQNGQVLVRTTTPVANGKAGLSYSAIPTNRVFDPPLYLCGLRQNASDRSNMAIQNMGSQPGRLVVKVFSGDGSSTAPRQILEETVEPGGFKQFNNILATDGLSLTEGR